MYRDSLPGNQIVNNERDTDSALKTSEEVSWQQGDASGHMELFSPRKHPPPTVIKKKVNAHTYLHGVAPQGGSTFKTPALLLGHHEQLSQALLHDPGKALVVQAHQRVVHTLEH